MKDTWKLIIVVATLLAASFLAGRWTKRAACIETIIKQTDTVTLWDTVFRDKPVPVREKVTETIYVAAIDTVRLHDTTYVAVPRTQQEYRDELYRAWVSGYLPQLDSIEVYTPTKYITRSIAEKPKKWHIGVQAGYGASKDGLSPYIGVGLTYSLVAF